jgi:phosphoglycerate kinase
MKTIFDINFKNKKALIRVDFNVPLDENFNVTDANRIEAAKPTIDKILNDGGAVILMSHLGRPKGKEEKYSLSHIVYKIEEVLGKKVTFASDCRGEIAKEAAANLQNGEILVLENLRFYTEEEAGDVGFSKELASLGDIYVNDAFGTAHRAHASTTIIANEFPNDKCFGALLAKEIESINKVLKNSEKPVTAILGGSKVSSKITIIENILDKVDHMIIGGGMTFTFIKAMGGNIGDSICEDDKMDAGPKTLEQFKEVVLHSKTILWNGPIGVFELPTFANGTISLGDFIAESTKNGCFSLVGGGDSVAAVKQFGLEDKMSYVSTGGGAMLEMLEGKTLPGIAAILS